MSVPPLGLVCSPDDYAQSISDPDSLYCLTRGDSIGLTITALAGFASLVGLLYVFRLIFRNLYRFFKRRETQIFHKPLDVLMLALFITDTLQAIGGAVNIYWVHIGKVELGNFCNAQGIIQNVGETGVALSNIWITFFTLYNVWMSGDPSMLITLISMGCACIFLVLIVTLGNTLNAAKKSKYIAPTPYWCWISKNYFNWRLFAEYVWLWVALGWSILAYILLWLFYRGHLVLGDRWIPHFRFRRGTNEGVHHLSHDAWTMLWYPLTYLITILPLSIIRWIGFVEEKKYGAARPHSPATFTFITIFTLSGLFNVVLLVTTRPEAGLFGRRPRPAVRLPVQYWQRQNAEPNQEEQPNGPNDS